MALYAQLQPNDLQVTRSATILIKMSTSFRAHASRDRKYKSILKYPLSDLITLYPRVLL
jgi:hypothetical protein